MGFPSGGGGSGPPLVYNVVDYGADPTGTNDSSAAFNSALALNLPVWVPPGNYRILAGINMAQGQHLIGPSPSWSYGGSSETANRARLFLDSGATVPMFSMADTDGHMTIENLFLDGAGVAQDIVHFPATSGFHDYFSDVKGCYFTNIGTGVYGLYGGNNTGSVYVSHCRFYQGTATGGNGVYFSTSSGFVINTLFNGFVGTGCYAAYNLGGYNNRYINCDFGVNNIGLRNDTQECLVLGCFFDRNNNEAILVNGSGTQIIGNQFHSNSQTTSGAAPDITLAGSLSDISIVGNYFGPLDGGIVNKTSYGYYVNTGTVVAAWGNILAPSSRTVGLTNWNSIQTAPTVPASGTALINPFSLPCMVYVNGGAVTAIAIRGATVLPGDGVVQLGSQDSITLTYTTAPTWVWSIMHD